MKTERDYLIVSIKAFLTRSGSGRDWDDFTSHPFHDAELDRIRRCAAAIDLPLDAEGEAALQDLLDQAELAIDGDPAAPRPWRLETGLAIGLVAGAALWWANYLPGTGLFHNLHLLIVPPAAGAFIVIQRNSRKQVGAYDPRIVAQNRKGRV